MKKTLSLFCAAALAFGAARAASLEASFRQPSPRAGRAVRAHANDHAKTYLVRVDTLLAGEMDSPRGTLLAACISRPDGYGVKVITEQLAASPRVTLPRGKWRVQLFMLSNGPAPGGERMRLWPADFNQRYRERYSARPDALYPSLFEDTGEAAGAHRARLFSLRDSLLAGAGDRLLEQPLEYRYPNRLHEGVERISVVASAGRNFAGPDPVCLLGADGAQTILRKAMDAYSRGAGRVEYRLADTTAADDPAKWVARCEALLGGSRHVCEVGVLYPISDIRSRYIFSDPYREMKGEGYLDLLRLLTTGARRDFTLVHPDALDGLCRVERGCVAMGGDERYRVMVVPGCRTIRLTNLEKLASFAAAGGTVLFTGCLPQFSEEGDGEGRVGQLVRRIMDSGRGFLTEFPDRDNLSEFFRQQLPDPDVTVEIVYSTYMMGDPVADARDEAFRDHAYAFNCAHRRAEGYDVYFLANPSDCRVEALLTFADRRAPQLWNPHTGDISPLQAQNRHGRTAAQITLSPLESRFIVFR